MTQEQVEYELKATRKNIAKLFSAIAKDEAWIREVKKHCTHPVTEYWNDPSGNNGGGLECKVCEKWL